MTSEDPGGQSSMTTVIRNNETKWQQERRDLAKVFQTELQKIPGLSGNIEIPSSWILNTVLYLTVDTDDWERYCDTIVKHMSQSSVILDYWFSEHDSSICLLMAEDCWQSRRLERFHNSRLLSPKNDDPVDSMKRTQTVRLVHRQPIKRIPRQLHYTPILQTMAHFLRTSLRLRQVDISIVTRLLEGLPTDVEWQSFADPSFINAFNDSANRFNAIEIHAMIESARNALSHAVTNQYHHRLVTAFVHPTDLSKLSDDHEISAANRSFEETWTVLAHFHGEGVGKVFLSRYPSFFVPWPPAISCDPQVHLLEGEIQKLEHCFLIKFISRTGNAPTKAAVDAAMAELCKYLKLPDTVKSLSTPPFQKTTEYSEWFRCDGIQNLFFRDKVLSAEMCKVKVKEQALKEEPFKDVKPISELTVPGRCPVKLILWPRQSGEETLQAGSLSRQLTKLVRCLPGLVQPGDIIEIRAEICSTHKHPLSDRNMWTGLDDDKPNQGLRKFILTTNPDRLTRRSDEVDTIVSTLESSGGWFVLGNSLGPEYDDEVFYKVENQIASEVKERLRLGRFRPKQSRFMWQQYHANIRICDFFDRTLHKTMPKQLKYLRAVLKLMVKDHGYERILLVSHVSPWTHKDQPSIKSSIVRQGKALLTLTGKQDVPSYQWRCQNEPTEDATFIDRLMRKVEAYGDRTLVVATSLDRLLSKTSDYEKLKTFCERKGNGVVSFTWDHETDLDVPIALRLSPEYAGSEEVVNWENSLDAQKRAPMLSTNLPLIQLILWICGNRRQTGHPADAVGRRHAKQAERAVQAGEMTKYQGDPTVDEALLRKNGCRTTLNDVTRWREHISETTGHPIDSIQVAFNNGQDAYYCHCEEKNLENEDHEHDTACECVCRFCDTARSCPCVANLEAKRDEPCECPPMCNCHCECCHKEFTELTRKRKHDSDDESKEPRLRKCANDTCTTEIPVHGEKKYSGRYCPLCVDRRKKNNVCQNPTCLKLAPQPGPLVCGTCGWQDNRASQQRKCKAQGCDKKAPKGGPHGRYCSDACRISGKAK